MRARSFPLWQRNLFLVLIGLGSFGVFWPARLAIRDGNIGAFLSMAGAQALLCLLGAALIWNAEPARTTLLIVLGFGGLLRLALLCETPRLSDDIYRYIWDGRVQAAGINPYRYIPADPKLAPLRDEEIYPHINRRNYAPTIYPPMTQYPNANMDNGIRLRPMQEELVREIRPVLLVLTAAVAFVLLIGCANVANLLLARASTRAKEISIRAALGASRWRLIRQLLTESVLLSFLGGALGLFLAVWSVPILLTFSPAELRDVHGIILNREVLSFSILASMLTGILFGLVPAIYASRANFSEALRDADRGSTLGRIRGRGILIAGEVAVSIILLIGAGLMLKSFAKLTHVDPGFNADRLLVFNIGYPPSADVARQTAFYQQVIERLRALPGVTAAGAVSRLPLSGGNSTRSFNLPGSDKNHDADIRVSTPDYLATMGIPLLKGRNLNEHDTSGTPLVAVINEIGARNVFGGADPLGKYITNFGPKNEKLQIVGVVGNVRHVGLEAQPRAEIYQPSGQAQWPSMFVAVRTATSNPRALISAVQNAVWSVDDNVPLANLRTMRDMIAASVVRQKFAMLLLAIFAGLAVCLAAIGLYGVISYSVSQRTREIGIRVALGARRGDVLRQVIGQGMLFAAIGVAAGVLVSLGMARLIANLLFAVSPTDSATFAGVATLLSLVALLACWLPARRASTVDPMVALREA